jgi:hypothetical protein
MRIVRLMEAPAVARTITLRIEGEEISAQVFHQKVGAFLEVLRDIERNVNEERTDPAPASVKWVLDSIRAESPVVMTLRADPAEDAKENAGEKVIAIATAGLKEIQSHSPLQELPPYFTMPVLEAVRTLVRPVDDDVAGITVITPEETVPLTGQATVNVERFLRPVFQHYGTVEGVLEMVSVAGRGPRINVKDRLSGRAISCIVPRERLSDVLQVFGLRVSVYGRVRTNELGDVLRIDMEEIEAFPTDDELPSVDQVAGAFDLTGGKTIEEHLKSLRDAS